MNKVLVALCLTGIDITFIFFISCLKEEMKDEGTAHDPSEEEEEDMIVDFPISRLPPVLLH
jgi:hypothetical protein